MSNSTTTTPLQYTVRRDRGKCLRKRRGVSAFKEFRCQIAQQLLCNTPLLRERGVFAQRRGVSALELVSVTETPLQYTVRRERGACLRKRRGVSAFKVRFGVKSHNNSFAIHRSQREGVKGEPRDLSRILLERERRVCARERACPR